MEYENLNSTTDTVFHQRIKYLRIFTHIFSLSKIHNALIVDLELYRCNPNIYIKKYITTFKKEL